MNTNTSEQRCARDAHQGNEASSVIPSSTQGHIYGAITLNGNTQAQFGDQHIYGNVYHIQNATFSPTDSAAVRDKVIVPSQNAGQLPVSSDPAPWLVPFQRGTDFIGRSDELVKIEGQIFSNIHHRVAIEGLGGSGKSRLALEVVHRLRQRHPGTAIFWVQCTDISSFERDFRNIAQVLHIAGADDPEIDIKIAIKAHFNRPRMSECIIVLDNADDEDIWINRGPKDRGFDALIDYIPKSSQCRIITTTRNHKIAVKIATKNVIRLKDLSVEEALSMLKSLLIRSEVLDDQIMAMTLLTKTTTLPLALVQAAAYINENDLYDLNDYVQLWNEAEETILELLSEDFEDEYRYSETQNPVATTFLISFEQIQHNCPLAAEILSYIACLDHQSLPKSILPLTSPQLELNKAFGVLTGYALIQPQQGRGTENLFDMHHLVHLAIRNWLRCRGQLHEWESKMAAHLLQVCSSSPDAGHMKFYLAHAEKLCYAHADSTEITQLRLMKVTGAYLNNMRQFARSYAILQLACKSWQSASDRYNIEMEECHIEMGWAARGLGRLRESRETIECAIENLVKHLPQDDPRLLRAKSRLPNLYRREGNLGQAEELSIEIIQIGSRIFGAGDELVIRAKKVLAWVHRDNGQLAKAESILLELHEMAVQSFGTRNYQGFKFAGDLAMVIHRQGRSREAQIMEEAAFEAYTRDLGEEHPSTLQFMFDLAIMYRNDGQLKRAEQLFLREVQIEERLKGENDSDILLTKSSLAKTYYAQGRFLEAEHLQEHLVKTGLRLFGQVSPDILLFATDLCNTKYALGEHIQATALLKRCLLRSEEILGHDHFHTVNRRSLLESWQSVKPEALDDGRESVSTSNLVLGI